MDGSTVADHFRYANGIIRYIVLGLSLFILSVGHQAVGVGSRSVTLTFGLLSFAIIIFFILGL